MAPTRKKLPKKRSASKSKLRQRKPKALRWQDVATYAVPKLNAMIRYRIRYGGQRGLDAVAAMTLLDNELAPRRIRYQARYLGIRDGRAVFNIRIKARFQDQQAVKDAIHRVGIQLPNY